MRQYGQKRSIVLMVQSLNFILIQYTIKEDKFIQFYTGIEAINILPPLSNYNMPISGCLAHVIARVICVLKSPVIIDIVSFSQFKSSEAGYEVVPFVEGVIHCVFSTCTFFDEQSKPMKRKYFNLLSFQHRIYSGLNFMLQRHDSNLLTRPVKQTIANLGSNNDLQIRIDLKKGISENCSCK